MRKQFNVPSLQWSDALEITAQTIAKTLASTCTFQHSYLQNTGENLYASSGQLSFQNALDGIESWSSEIKDLCPLKVHDATGSWKKIQKYGHATQMIWSKTTHVGCGIAYNHCKLYTVKFVCLYQPPGNRLGVSYTGEKIPKARLNRVNASLSRFPKRNRTRVKIDVIRKPRHRVNQTRFIKQFIPPKFRKGNCTIKLN